MPVKPKFGMVRFGTGVKFGYGTSDPGFPTPLTVAARVMRITSDGFIQVVVGQPSETVVLQSPDLTKWDVLFSGTTGLVTATSGSVGTVATLSLISTTGNQWDITITNAGLLQVTFNSNVLPARYTLETTPDTMFELEDSIVMVSDAGIVSVLAIGFATEAYILQSPDLTFWTVTFDGTTGGVTLISGGSGPAVTLQRTSPHGIVYTFTVDNGGVLSLTSSVSPFAYEPSRAFSVSSAGIVTVNAGHPNETWTLADSNGDKWLIEADGATGLVSLRSGATGTVQTVNLTASDGSVWDLVPTPAGLLTVVGQTEPYTGYVTIVPTYTEDSP